MTFLKENLIKKKKNYLEAEILELLAGTSRWEKWNHFRCIC